MQIHILRTIGWLPFSFSPYLSQLSFLAKALNCLASYLSPNIFLFTHVSISALEIRVLQFWGFFSLYLKLGKWKCFECKWKQYCKNSSCALQNKNEWAINVCICVWRTFTFARHDEARKMFHYQFKLIKYPDTVLQTSMLIGNNNYWILGTHPIYIFKSNSE